MIRIGLEKMDRFSLNAVRLIISAVVLGAFAIAERRQGIQTDRDLSWRPILGYTLLISVLYQLFFLIGVSHTASGTTSLILSTIPMWTALLARTFLGEELKPLAWLGLATAFSGTLTVTLEKGANGFSQNTLFGNLLIIAAAVCWAAGTVCSRPLMQRISPMQLAAWSTIISLPLHLAAAVPNAGAGVRALTSPDVWAVVVYSGLFSTGLALPMWNFGVRRAGAAQAAVFQNLVPVIAMATAWLFRGERVSLFQVIGGTLIIGGLLIMRRARR